MDGPLHDGERVIDSRYASGAWETLTVLGPCMVMVGGSPDGGPTAEGKMPRLQGGMFMTARGPAGGFTMVSGGGE